MNTNDNCESIECELCSYEHETYECDLEFCRVCLEEVENCDADGHDTDEVAVCELWGADRDEFIRTLMTPNLV